MIDEALCVTIDWSRAMLVNLRFSQLPQFAGATESLVSVCCLRKHKCAAPGTRDLSHGESLLAQPIGCGAQVAIIPGQSFLAVEPVGTGRSMELQHHIRGDAHPPLRSGSSLARVAAASVAFAAPGSEPFSILIVISPLATYVTSVRGGVNIVCMP